MESLNLLVTDWQKFWKKKLKKNCSVNNFFQTNLHIILEKKLVDNFGVQMQFCADRRQASHRMISFHILKFNSPLGGFPLELNFNLLYMLLDTF